MITDNLFWQSEVWSIAAAAFWALGYVVDREGGYWVLLACLSLVCALVGALTIPFAWMAQAMVVHHWETSTVSLFTASVCLLLSGSDFLRIRHYFLD